MKRFIVIMLILGGSLVLAGDNPPAAGNVGGFLLMVGALIGGAVLKYTGALTKISEWFKKMSAVASKVGFNTGVAVTTKMNQLPVIGIFWESLIEPILRVVLEFLPGVVFNFLSGVVEGLREDSKEFKKLDAK